MKNLLFKLSSMFHTKSIILTVVDVLAVWVLTALINYIFHTELHWYVPLIFMTLRRVHEINLKLNL